MERKNLGLENEKEIVKEIIAGKKELYALLVKEYQENVYNLVYKMIGNIEDAKDLTQETFIKAYLYLKSYNPNFKFPNWLYKIATNLCRNYKSKHFFEENLSATYVNKNGVNLLKYEIYQAISKLPKEYKEIIILRHIQELSYEEIGDVLNISLGTVKSRLYRAREALKEILKPEMNYEM